MLRFLGINDDYDYLKFVTYSRLGRMPLISKAFLLSNYLEVEIIEVRRRPFRGFLFKGRKRGQVNKESVYWTEELSLVDKETKRVVKFIYGSEEKNSLLKTILKEVE